MSGACSSAVSRWKKQYLAELSGNTPVNANAITPDKQRIQLLEKQLKQAQRDNDILKKAAAFFIRDNPNLN
jgi:transposase